MRYALLSLWLCLGLLAAGCTTTAEREGLPTGVTLLDSASGYCSGELELDADPDVVLDLGESTTVAMDDEDLEWECLADASSQEGELECPEGTTYVRVTRDSDKDEFSMECFGG